VDNLQKYIGKEYWFLMPEFVFGNCNFRYWHFKIVKSYKKTFKVETIEQFGATHENKVRVDRIEKGYFKTLKKGIDWNKIAIKNTIDKKKRELKTYTKLHDKYREIQDTIFILNNYLDMLNHFSLDSLKETSQIIRKYFLKRCIFNKGDRVKTPDRGIGKVSQIITYLYKTQLSHNGNSLIDYGVDFKDGFGTYSQNQLKHVASRTKTRRRQRRSSHT